jgi:hypothetical protein
VYAPPWNHTITGSRLVPALAAGVWTLTTRQSSAVRNAFCAQLGGVAVASRTPAQRAAGAGAANRRSPVGGAAYGMP